MQLVGGGLNQCPEAQFFSLLAQPDTAVIVTADPAKVVWSQAQGGAIIQHAPVRIAHGRIYDLAHCQATDVSGQYVLQQRLCIRTQHLELAQRREVHDYGPFPAGPVFVHGTDIIENGWQPVASIFGEVTSQLCGASMEASLAGQLGVGVRCHSVGDCFRKGWFRSIHAYVYVCRIPAIGSTGVVRAGARSTDQIGQRPQQDIVAGP